MFLCNPSYTCTTPTLYMMDNNWCVLHRHQSIPKSNKLGLILTNLFPKFSTNVTKPFDAIETHRFQPSVS